MSLPQPLTQPLPLPRALTRIGELLARRVPTEAADPERRWAAVALLLSPDPESLLLIRRAIRADDPWSGHVGLPGGIRAPEDEDLVATAVRETGEEVGIDLSHASRLGVLDDVAPRTPTLPPIAVRPYVFAIPARPALSLGPEVASAHWILVSRLRRPEARQSTTVMVRGQPLIVGCLAVDDLVIWGMTDRILDSFLQATVE